MIQCQKFTDEKFFTKSLSNENFDRKLKSKIVSKYHLKERNKIEVSREFDDTEISRNIDTEFVLFRKLYKPKSSSLYVSFIKGIILIQTELSSLYVQFIKGIILSRCISSYVSFDTEIFYHEISAWTRLLKIPVKNHDGWKWGSAVQNEISSVEKRGKENRFRVDWWRYQ